MLKKLTAVLLVAVSLSGAFAQNRKSDVPRLKLVVGIVIDQMRWDYLYRFYDKYENDGFKRLLNTGYSLNNVHIDYVPTVTAIGHSSIYTGSVPSIHGIAGNTWIDKETGKDVYCTADLSVKPVGSDDVRNGSHSPKNLLSTTISDQLRLATNFESKVIGVSLKDRASILPAGHNPTGAYWFDDKTGNFITSSYYTPTLPKWVQDFNDKKLGEKLVSKGWNTLQSINQYKESSADNVTWEGLLGSAKTPSFPYKDLAADYKVKKDVIRSTPFGNTLTFEMAEASVEGEDLGRDDITDFLAINLASTDYVGHKFGPNSIEVQDVYMRLDRDLADFFRFLDNKVGKGQYTLFISADHGGAHSIGFLEENKMPTGVFAATMKSDVNKSLQAKFGVENLILDIDNYQVYFDRAKMSQANLELKPLVDFAVAEIRKDPSVLYAIDVNNVQASTIPELIKQRIINGINWQRSGDIQLVSKDGMLSSYAKTGSSHSVWNSYDSHIPLVFMGWGIQHGESNKPYNMTDIAPTLSALLKIQFPSGSIGNPITEVVGK